MYLSLLACTAVSLVRQPYVTDNDNYIIDLKFEKPIADADQVNTLQMLALQ
jgi:ribose 5-phosphate isomerase